MARAAAAAARGDGGRGRRAERPQDIPTPGWRDIALRTKNEISDDHVSITAAGVAFYALLAIFPAIAALISIWGLVADPAQMEQQIQSVAGMLPQEAASILRDQAHNVASNAGGALSFGLIFGLLLTLYSAAAGMKALIEGLNIAYDEEEKRSFIRYNLIALGLTLGAIVAVIVVLGLIAVVPALLGNLGLGSTAETLITWLRWPLLFVFAMVGLTVLYRYAPSRDEPRWRWVSWGSVIATLLWVLGSMAFSVYVRNFASYNETYGSLGAVVILLMWLWLSAFIVLLGAELNSEMEHQTGEDTTTGPARPLGQRGARMADTVGRSP